MPLPNLIKSKSIQLTTMDGETKTFLISRFPAIEGREIVTQYVASGMPQIGNYDRNIELVKKAMRYCSVITENGDIRLQTDELINNHVDDWETLGRLELEMLKYNTSFFTGEKISGFLESMIGHLPALITRILTAYSEASSRTNQQASENSGKSMTSKTH